MQSQPVNRFPLPSSQLAGRPDTEAEVAVCLGDPKLDSSKAKLLEPQESCPPCWPWLDTEQGRPKGKWERQPWCQDNIEPSARCPRRTYVAHTDQAFPRSDWLSVS